MRSRKLLTRVFLRRFIENDLISPDTDHMQVVSTAAGGLFAAAMFVTVFMGIKYVMAPFPSPGSTAVIELDDQFLFCAWPMLVMSIVALVEWDVLGFDSRDSAILGPLPIPRAAIVLAKLTAIVLFAAVFLAALTVAPAVLHPVLVISRLRASVGTAVVLMAAQLAASVAAGLFGFSATLAVREVVHALLGASLFRRVSRGLQVALLTSCATMLLLMPLASSRVALRIMQQQADRSELPPDWFVAVHETIGGHLIDALPRPELPPRVAQHERLATSEYRAAKPRFVVLSWRAAAALLISVALAVSGFAWNARRLAPPPFDRTRRRRSRWVDYVGAVFVPRDPTARAGFHFAARTLGRSVVHRMAVVAAVAAALAASLVVVHASIAGGGGASPSVFAMQPFALAVLLAAFRHAVRLPAELRAGWCVSMAWRARVRPYFAGVKRAAVVGIVLPATVAFVPLYAWMVDWRSAVWLAAIGFLLGRVLLDLLLLDQRTLPFMTEHVPSENFNTRAPFYILALLSGAYGFGLLDQVALGHSNGAMTLALILAAAVLLLRIADARRRVRWAGLELQSDAHAASFVE